MVDWLKNKIKTKTAKVGGGVVGGGSVLAVIFFLHGNLTGEIEKAEARSKEHIDLKLEPFKVEVKNLKEKVYDTNLKVNELYKHTFKQKE